MDCRNEKLPLNRRGRSRAYWFWRDTTGRWRLEMMELRELETWEVLSKPVE